MDNITDELAPTYNKSWSLIRLIWKYEKKLPKDMQKELRKLDQEIFKLKKESIDIVK